MAFKNTSTSKAITPAEAMQRLALQRTSRQMDALSYDNVRQSPSGDVTPQTVVEDSKHVLPSVDRVVVGSHRLDDDAFAFWDGGHSDPRLWQSMGTLCYVEQLPNGKLVFSSERPMPKLILEYKDVPKDTGGRIALKGNREGTAKFPTPRPLPKATGNPVVGTNISLLRRHIKFFNTNGAEGTPHPELNRQEWLDANSGPRHTLLPTAKVCQKCGYQDCQCNRDKHPVTCECPYHAALRRDASRLGYKTAAHVAVVIPRLKAKGGVWKGD